MWATWPIVTTFEAAIPTSDGHLGTVPLFNAWTIWWNAESLSHGLSDYWNAPIFYPALGAFALSEPQPATLVLAPLVWYADSPVPAYNSYLIASLVLNGWFAARLLAVLHCQPMTQFFGGLAILLHPLALQNIEAIQLVPLWGALWTMTNIMRLGRKPSWQNGIWTGIALASVAATSIHQALLLSILVVSSLALLAMCYVLANLCLPGLRGLNRNLPTYSWRAVATAWGLAGLTSVILLLPLVGPMALIQSSYAVERPPELVVSLSANLRSWSTAPSNSVFRAIPLLKTADPGQFPEPLLPGWLSPGLALIGLSQWGRQRRIVCFGRQLLWAIAVFSFAFSFGPGLEFGNWNPWNWIAEHFSPVARIRSPYRFAYFTQVSIILLACLASDRFVGKRSVCGNRFQHLSPQRAWTRLLASVCLLMILAFENIPGQVRLVFPPTYVPNEHGWVNFLAETKDTAAILCLPTARGINESSQESVTLWMYYATQHRLPILNGYSGFTPSQWWILENKINSFGLNQNLESIKKMGANLIVVRKGQFPMPTDHPRLSVLFETDEIQIWKLH